LTDGYEGTGALAANWSGSFPEDIGMGDAVDLEAVERGLGRVAPNDDETDA
jgi:hypothetical protein